MSDSLDIIDDHLDLGDQRLEYRWIGPRPDQAPTLVFLHEGLGCVGMWRDFPQRAAERTGWGVLVYSRRGYGTSDPYPLPRAVDYLDPEALDVLPRVLDALGVRRAILVGHSDGGSIAIIHAGSEAAGDRLLGAVTLAAHVFNEEVCVASIREAKLAFESGGLRDRLARYHGANVDNAFWGWNDIWLHPDFWHWNIEARLPRIRVPLVVVQGEDDEYGTLRQVDAIIGQSGGPAERLVLPDCKHSIHRDQPEATLAAIEGLIARVSA